MDKVKELIENGVDINDEKYNIVLHEASVYGNIEIIKYLIGLNVDVNGQNDRKETPLHEACWNTQTLAVKELIKAGADVHVLNEDGISPLYATALQGGYHTASLLIEKGAEVDVFIAAMIGDLQFIKAAFDSNPDILNSNDKRFGHELSLLHWAAKRNHICLVKFFIESGINPNIKDKFNNTPLHSAAYFDFNLDSAKLLIDCGCSIDIPNDFGNTPLHHASRATKIIHLLCEKGHTIDPINEDGDTPLHEMVRACNVDGVKIILKYGALKNIKNHDGLTPLKYIKKIKPGDDKATRKEIAFLLKDKHHFTNRLFFWRKKRGRC